jgi:hypothetical protein
MLLSLKRLSGLAPASMCLALFLGSVSPAWAGFQSATGIVPLARFQTANVNLQQPNIAIPFPNYLFLTGQDQAIGASAQVGIGYLFAANTDLVGITLAPGSFVQVTGLSPFPSAALLNASFSITYLANAAGASGQSNAALTVQGTLPAAGSYAAFTAQINYSIDNNSPFATQSLSYDTRISGPRTGPFSVPLSAPPVVYFVNPGHTLTISGSVNYQVGSASLTAPPAFGSPPPVPAPSSVVLMAIGAPILLVSRRCRLAFTKRTS